MHIHIMSEVVKSSVSLWNAYYWKLKEVVTERVTEDTKFDAVNMSSLYRTRIYTIWRSD